MTPFRSVARVVQTILGSKEPSRVENWCPMTILALLERRRGLWYPVGWWQSWYDRVSPVLAY